MGNWIPGDPTLVAQILRISSAYSPPPPEGFVSPMTWGVKDDVAERFAARRRVTGPDLVHRDDVHVPLRRLTVGLRRLFRSYYGPTMTAFEAAEGSGRADDLQRELEELFDEQNVSQTPGTTTIPATFLHVVVDV